MSWISLIVNKALLIAIATSVAYSVQAQTPKPLLAVPDVVVLASNFDINMPLPKSTWVSRQGTRWSIRDGVLHGEQSSPEFQASKQDHFGYEPRLSIPVTPNDFVASFKIRFKGGSETQITPFIEFDHHVCRVRFSQKGTVLLADHEVWKVAEAVNFTWQKGRWYSITAERKGSEFVMQIKDGPTLFADHPTFSGTASSGGNGLGVAGPKRGEIEIDDLKIWSVKQQTQKEWPATRAKFPRFTPVQVKKPKPKKPATVKGNAGSNSFNKPNNRKKQPQ